MSVAVFTLQHNYQENLVREAVQRSSVSRGGESDDTKECVTADNSGHKRLFRGTYSQM